MPALALGEAPEGGEHGAEAVRVQQSEVRVRVPHLPGRPADAAALHDAARRAGGPRGLPARSGDAEERGGALGVLGAHAEADGGDGGGRVRVRARRGGEEGAHGEVPRVRADVRVDGLRGVARNQIVGRGREEGEA